MPEIRRTTIPQFSLRGLLLATAVMGVVSLVVSQAIRGTAWVGGISLGLGALVLAFVVYVAVFAIIALCAKISGRTRRPAKGSATSTAPKSLLVACMLLSAAVGVKPALAASGGVLYLPRLAPGEADKTGGLSLSLDMNWVDSSGYRPVRVEIKSTKGPVTADRVITVRFRPKQSYTRYDSVVVTQVLEIPAGATSAKATLSTPQFGPWGMFELDVLEDGEYIKQLSIGENQGWASWSATNKGDAASPVTLLLSGADTLTGEFMINNPAELLYVQPDNPTATIDPAIINAAPNLGTPSSPSTPVASSAPTLDDLPTKWIDYSGFDLMMVSLDRLQTLADKHPAQWEAIRDWLHNGGNLVVFGVGKKWEEIGKLEGLLGLDGNPPSADSEDIDPGERGWNLPRELLRRTTSQDAVGGDFSSAYTVAQPTLESPDAATTNDPNSEPPTAKPTIRPDPVVAGVKARFVTRRSGLGLVAAIRSTDQFDRGEAFPWKWLYNSIGASRWQWPARWGVTLYGTNDSYWNFLIPGVGLVPVTNFQILITLFVVVIGPVNYYLLRRWGKLNLTVLTIPTGALLLTASLLLYALFSDGLSVRLRARSVTHINQTSGEATCWSRLSYYAGLAPAGGLEFAEDTAVIPFELQPFASIEGGPRRVVDWTRTDPARPDSPLSQRLPEGWLNSRTPTQLITARIRKSPAHLEIQPATASGKAPQVKNRLGTGIVRMMLTDEHGKTFTAGAAAQDAAVNFEETASTKEILELLTANQPSVPNSAAEAGHNGVFGLNKRRPYYQGGVYTPPVYVSANPGMAYVATSQNGGLLENSFNEIYGAIMSGNLPARSYVAVVDRSPEFQSGTSLAKEEASFHVVKGALVSGIAMTPMIEFRRLHRYFGRTKAVNDVTFEVNRGQVFGYIGPNGAGKTTSMRILATLDCPQSGDAYVDGFSVIDDPDRVRRRLGFMPDYYGTYPNVNVLEYLDFFARAYGIRGTERRRAMNYVLDFTGLDKLQTKEVNGLSKGMKQRLGLGRTMIHDPPVLVLDEPAAGLDPRARIELREMIRRLAADGKTILVSSHILTELAEMCDVVGIIEQGKVLAVGSVAEIQRQGQQHERASVQLRILGGAEIAKQWLAARDDVHELKIEGENIVFAHDGDENSEADLLRELVKAEFRVVAFGAHQKSLEDVFLQVTKGLVQ